MTTTFEDFALCVLIKTDNHNSELGYRLKQHAQQNDHKSSCHPEQAKRVEGSWHLFYCKCKPYAKISRLGKASLEMTYRYVVHFITLAA